MAALYKRLPGPAHAKLARGEVGAILAPSPPGSPMSAPSPLAAGLLVLGGIAAPAAADESWTSVKTSHFEVLSDGGPERARAVAVRLEQFRRVVEAGVGPAEDGNEPPTVVLAFRDQASFAPYLPLYHGQPQ